MIMYEDKMYQGIAEQITESGQLGLAQQIYESMCSQAGISNIKTEE